MVNEIVEIIFPHRPNVCGYPSSRYAVYSGFHGKILSWFDLDHNIGNEQKLKLPKEIAQQMGCDGTATFSTQAEAERVIDALKYSW